MSNNKKFVLSEKYRPVKPDDLIGNKKQWKTLFAMMKEVKKRPIKPILLYGYTGVGKTTAIRIIVAILRTQYKEIEYKYTNAGNESKAENMREDIVPFLKTPKRRIFNRQKILFMDELNLNSTSQEILKTPLEETNIIVLASTNNDPFSNKFDKAFISRFSIIRLDPVEARDIVKRLRYICEQEEYKYEEEALEYLAKESEGSVRNAIDDMYMQWTTHKEVKLQNMTASKRYFDVVKTNLGYLILGDFPQGRDKNFEMIKEMGLTAREFLKQLNEVIIRYDKKVLNNLFKARLCNECGRTEFQIIAGGDSGIQLTSLFGQIVAICDPLAKKINAEKLKKSK